MRGMLEFACRVAAVWLLLFAAAPGWAQSPGQNYSLGLDTNEWDRLALRAEEAIAAAAASDTAFLVLREQISDWRTETLAEQSELESQIDQLSSQLSALGAAEGDEQDATGTAAIRRGELENQLAAANAPFRVAEEIIRRADGLLAEIDKILEAREREQLFRLSPTPLNPANWSGAASYLMSFLNGIRQEISDAWSSDAQRRRAEQNIPAILLFVAVGIFLLTRGRSVLRRWTAGAEKSSDDSVRGTLTLLAGLLTEFAMPTAGIWAIANAADSTSLAYMNSGRVLEAIPIAAAVIFGSRWLAAYTFSNSDTGILRSRLDETWTAAARRATVAIGWLIAARIVFYELTNTQIGNPELDTILTFPILLAVSFCSFRLSRLLSAHASAPPEEGTESNWDRFINLLAWAVLAVSVAAPLLGAVGYEGVANFLLYPAVLTLALFAAYFAANDIIFGLYTSALKAVGFTAATRTAGFVRFAFGILLFAVSLPILAYIWGASENEIAEYWSMARDGVLIGGQRFTAGDFLTLVLVFLVGVVATNMIQTILRSSVLPNTYLDVGAQKAITTGTGYVGIILVSVLAVSVAGIDLTNVAIVAGALSVGIGFGLQAIVSNFVSGIILLIERPINEGDWIEAGGVSGTVQRISVRSTQIMTFDRATVVVPNTDLMSGQVTNWTLGNRYCRIRVPVGVAYGTETRTVERVLMEIAHSHDAVLDDPAPAVIFMGFGDSALNFELRLYLKDVNFFLSAKSEINFAVAKRFEEEGIAIPFPQRDIWIRNADAEDGQAKTRDEE